MTRLKVVTFNLRTDVSVDGTRRFAFRKGVILDRLEAERADVIGFQECAVAMKAFLRAHLRDYALVGCGRTAEYACESVPIAFLRDKYELLSLDTFWLSPTPDVPGSRFPEQSEYPRVCTLALLRPWDGAEPFYVANTHLDHVSDAARVLGARCLMERLGEATRRRPHPVALTGDMNAEPGSEAIRAFTDDHSLKLTDQTDGIPTSFHDYGATPDAARIDYILTNGFRRVGEPRAWTETLEGVYLSDHYPLEATLEA